jgi:lipoyl(octanoyl) transferase
MNKEILLSDWGLIDYKSAWEQQETIFNNTIRQKKSGEETFNHLIFCEHPHVYTLGKSGDEHNLLIDFIQLQANDAQFVKTNRGGDITYHGPGQLVVYPVFDLANFGIGLKQYIFYLEQAIINCLSENYGISSERLDKATGVWLEPHSPRARKVCAIGVRSAHFITMHGFALNANTNLNYFRHINPCGFIDKGVTSLAAETGKDIDMPKLKIFLYKSIMDIFHK